jgi:hypothetical protein
LLLQKEIQPPKSLNHRFVGLLSLLRGLEEGGVENGPEVNDPPQQNKPEDRRQTKLDDRHQQPPLKQLPQAGNKKAAESGKNIASRTLACHAFDLMSGSRIDKFILDPDCQGRPN